MADQSRTVVHLEMSGEFDISNKESLCALLRQGESADVVIIDMTNTTYIDSTALHCLTDLRKRLLTHGEGVVRLVGVSPSISKLFAITGLDGLFEIRPAGVPTAVKRSTRPSPRNGSVEVQE